MIKNMPNLDDESVNGVDFSKFKYLHLFENKTPKKLDGLDKLMMSILKSSEYTFHYGGNSKEWNISEEHYNVLTVIQNSIFNLLKDLGVKIDSVEKADKLAGILIHSVKFFEKASKIEPIDCSIVMLTPNAELYLLDLKKLREE